MLSAVTYIYIKMMIMIMMIMMIQKLTTEFLDLENNISAKRRLPLDTNLLQDYKLTGSAPFTSIAFPRTNGIAYLLIRVHTAKLNPGKLI